MATSHGICLCRVTAIQLWTIAFYFFYYYYYYYFETTFFNVNITQSKAEYLKFWFPYTNLNYQMVSMEKFPDKFLTIWKTEIAAMKLSAEVTYCWSPEVRKCRNTSRFWTLIKKHRKPASSLSCDFCLNIDHKTASRRFSENIMQYTV